MVFHWSLYHSKSLYVYRTLLSILANLNSAVVWMVFTRFLISNSSSTFTNPSMTVPSAAIIIGITVTFMFHSVFSSLARSRYLSLFSPSFNFTLWSAGTAKSMIRQVFLMTITRSGHLAEFRRSFVYQNPREACASRSPGQILGCAYTTCSRSQISISCTVPSGSRSPPSCFYSYTLFALICCIRLLSDWWFHLCHRIAYICYFVASYLFSLWYDWFLRRCFVLLLEEILFLS